MLCLADVFQDHMVLQRHKPIAVFGTSETPGTVTLAGQSVAFTPLADGRFLCYLPAMPAGGPHTLTVTAGSESVSRTDVLIGEVYIAGGQSNMQLHVEDTVDIQPVDRPQLRYFREPHYYREDRTAGCDEPCWQPFTKEQMPGFSAVGSSFALHLANELPVPIGIVSCNTGASRVDAWTAPEITQTPEYQRLVSEPHPDYENYRFNQDNWLYWHKLLPIVPYTAAGVLWYQGESNRGRAEAPYYDQLLAKMIENWRALWQEELPFYLVQLMPYADGAACADLASIRLAQERASRQIPHTAMVTLVETGESHEIHPTHKDTVGHALANAVLHWQFGRTELEYSGPICTACRREENGAQLIFSHADGLHFAGGKAEDIQVIDRGGAAHAPTAAVIEGNTLHLRWEAAVDAAGIDIGYRNAPQHTLYNAAGYLASPVHWLF